MSKYFNPRLLNAVIAGTGMRNPVRPHVILGSEDGEFVRGDLMDANAIQEFINQKISDLVNNAPEALDTLKELADALNDDSNFATTVLNKFNSLSTYTAPFAEEHTPQIGDYLYADFTCGSSPQPGYLGRCIGTADLYDDNLARWATVSPSKMKWSEESVDTSLTNYDTDTESMLGPGSSSDFGGQENTAVLTALSASYPAAEWAASTFSGNGYLPAAGELLRDVNTIFDYFPTSGTTGYWSSTEYNNQYAWFLGSGRRLESSYLKTWADNKVIAFYKGNPVPKNITIITSETQAFTKDSNYNIWSNKYSYNNTIPAAGVSANIIHGSENTFSNGSSTNTVIGSGNTFDSSSNNTTKGSGNSFANGASYNVVDGSGNTVLKSYTTIKGNNNKRYVSSGASHSGFGDPVIKGSGNILQNGGNAGIIHGNGNTIENSGLIYHVIGSSNIIKEGGPSRTIIGDGNTLQTGAKVEFLSGSGNQLKTSGQITRAGFGSSNTIESSGGVEFLVGDQNTIGGYVSRFIFGNKNNTKYAGKPLIVVGDENTIQSGNGDNITFGNKNNVSLNAVVFGLQNTASLKDSYVFGKENNVSVVGQQAADNSEFPQEQVIFGRGNTTYGSSFIYGKNNISQSSCHGNFISGYNNNVDDSYVTVFGKNNTVQNGSNKIIVGNSNTSSGNGVNIFGNNNSPNGYPQYGLIVGTNHESGAYKTGGITCGTYSDASYNGIFVVGDGTQSARSNAFEVTNTQTISRGTITAPDVSFTYGSGASATTQSLASLYGQVQDLSSALGAAIERIAALETIVNPQQTQSEPAAEQEP